MENLAYELRDTEEQQAFVIDGDSKAEYALKMIADATAENQRLVNVCDTAISEYQYKKQRYAEKLDRETGYLKAQLQMYFETVPHKATKTMETYELLSGKLKLKYATNEFVKDDEKLVAWLKEYNKTDFIQTVEKPKWGELKKTCQVSGTNVIDADGLIIEGIVVEKKQEKFEIEF